MYQPKTPNHVCLIPDGNRRWARLHGISVLEAHEVGQATLTEVLVNILEKTTVSDITIWLMSTDNLDRCQLEVDAIYNAIRKLARNMLPVAHKEKCRLRRIGEINKLPSDILEIMGQAERETHYYSGRCLNFAINYGGRNDIVTAINEWILQNPGKSKITENDINQYLEILKDNYPAPDLIIRTGCDSICKRTSGFFAWQSIYSEFYFIDKMLPDLRFQDVELALEAYAKTNRRFGM